MGRILIRKTPDGEPKSNNKERVSHREVRKRESGEGKIRKDERRE
jgi:hypothetical protein